MTILFVLFAVFVPIVIFGTDYIIRGIQAALVAMGVMIIGFLALYTGMIYLIVNSMDWPVFAYFQTITSNHTNTIRVWYPSPASK